MGVRIAGLYQNVSFHRPSSFLIYYYIIEEKTSQDKNAKKYQRIICLEILRFT
jgi:hypothetical protein